MLNRTNRTEGASTTLYLRDGGQVVGEWNGTSWTKEYVWLGSTLLATIEGSTIKYHHQDHLSIRATTFADGMVGEEQGHYPFGEPWYETSPETTRIFTTYEREAGGSLDYAMFRWMGPEAGRFLSADPVHGSMGDGQSWNRYAYAGNDPVNRWDPWGLFFTDAGSPEVSSLFDPITGASGAGGGGGASGGCEDGDSYVCGYTDGSPIYCWCVDGVWVAFFDTVEGTAKGPAQPRGWQGLVWYVSMPGGGSRGGGGGGAGGGGSLSRGGCTWIDGSRDPFLVEWGAYMANLAALANPSRGEFYAGFAPAPGPLSGFRMTAGPTYLPYDQTRGRAGGNVSAPIHTTIFVHTHAWAGLAPHLSSSNFSVADFSPGAILDPKNPMSSLTHYVVGFEGWSMYRGGIVYCLRNVPGAGGR
jgi:RHS repeat-associated protein